MRIVAVPERSEGDRCEYDVGFLIADGLHDFFLAARTGFVVGFEAINAVLAGVMPVAFAGFHALLAVVFVFTIVVAAFNVLIATAFAVAGFCVLLVTGFVDVLTGFIVLLADVFAIGTVLRGFHVVLTVFLVFAAAVVGLHELLAKALAFMAATTGYHAVLAEVFVFVPIFLLFHVDFFGLESGFVCLVFNAFD